MVEAEDRVIARIGDRQVMYGEVWCDRALAASNREWLKDRTAEDACVAAEREQFRQLAARILVEKICALDSCVPADADIEPFRSGILKDEAMLQKLAAEGRRVPEAVRRVYRGESIEVVYDDVIKPMNKPLDVFKREVAMYRSLEVVERYLAKDFAATARQQFEQRARDAALQAALRKRIEALAASNNQSLANAADDYLRSMIERIGVSVLDKQFELPTGREVFP